MTIEQIDQKLKELSTTCSIKQAKSVVDSLVSLLGINETKTEKLLQHRSIDREVARFVNAPMFANQAAAYTIPHDTEEPIDLKLFWVKNTTKANLSWLVALTPNFEDDPENNENANIGIDFVLSESCDRLYILLSYKLKLRVLELHETLSHTQKEILENWVQIRRDLDPTSDTYKEQLRSHLWRSFDFEPVNKFFYSQLIQQFDHLVSHLKSNNIPEEKAKMFAVKLFGRTLFLWFLRKKEFLNPKISYFEVKGEDNQTKYYQDFLEPLFFEVLNSEIRGRKYPDDITPFLNGGLFEPTETDFYKDSNLTFPDGFFTQFYALLNKFNFTVDEGTSDYEQVAVDPEMLGRVFENLLASINPETETNARKAKGAFYTPRTIVDYMCEQSLIEYLKTKLPETSVRDQRIEELVTMNESDFREQDHNKRRDWKRDLGKEEVIKVLDELRVLDPAVGSGAFPMGMLQLLVKVYSRIETANEKDLAGLKREILSRSLYGVDIDQMAIQISRLRAWLSILVDMQDLRKVDPLPNLDFKFVCANTLVPLAEGTQDNLFDEHQLKEELIEMRDKYYEVTKKTDKKKVRDQYLAKIHDGGLFAVIESYRQKQLRDYNPFDSLNSSSFYDPSLMHGVNSFGIVIGNPPYVQVIKTTIPIKHYPYSAGKDKGKQNLYKVFIERSKQLAMDNGLVCLITQSSLMADVSSEFTREMLLTETSLLQILEFPKTAKSQEDKVFQSVLQGTCIVFFKIELSADNVFLISSGNSISTIKKISGEYLKQKDILNIYPSGKYFPLVRNGEFNLLKKILNNKLRMSEFIESSSQGDFNLTTNRDKFSDFISEVRMIRGKGVHRFWLQYSENEYMDTNFKKNIVIENKLSQYFLSQNVTGTTDKHRLHFCLTDKNAKYLCGHSVNKFKLKDDECNILFLGVLNSKAADWIFRKTSTNNHVNGYEIDEIPVPSFFGKDDICIKIQNYVERIILKKKTDSKADVLDLEKKVDELVMDLYNLTPEEKQIIQNS